MSLAAATITIPETSTPAKEAKLNSVPAISALRISEISTPPKTVDETLVLVPSPSNRNRLSPVFGGVDISEILKAEIAGTLLSFASLAGVDVSGMVMVAAASDISLILAITFHNSSSHSGIGRLLIPKVKQLRLAIHDDRLETILIGKSEVVPRANGQFKI
nr:hypothetical protein [Tanacetum cinerariifolium]